MEFVPATPAHARELARNMRPEEIQEVQASHGMGPLGTLLECVRDSKESYAAIHDDQVVAMFGVYQPISLTTLGVPWLLTSNYLATHPKHLLRWTKAAVAYLLEHYDRLVNVVDYRYKASLRWAEWAGFTVHPPHPVGVNGELFCKIELRRT